MRGERLLQHLSREDARAHLLLEHALDQSLAGRRRVVKLEKQQHVQRVVRFLRRRDPVQRLGTRAGQSHDGATKVTAWPRVCLDL